MMKALIATLVVLGSFAVAHADEAMTSADSHRASKCSAQPVDRYYCPDSSGQWWGPYFDNGCSVSCPQGQKAVCESASCDDTQPVASSCSCR